MWTPLWLTELATLKRSELVSLASHCNLEVNSVMWKGDMRKLVSNSIRTSEQFVVTRHIRFVPFWAWRTFSIFWENCNKSKLAKKSMDFTVTKYISRKSSRGIFSFIRRSKFCIWHCQGIHMSLSPRCIARGFELARKVEHKVMLNSHRRNRLCLIDGVALRK